MTNFIDRKIDLHALHEDLEQSGFKLIIIKGRRRVGKTELINQALQSFPKSAYFKYTAFPEADNLVEIISAIEKKFPVVKGIIAKHMRSVFYNLSQLVNIIVIDEFPYFLPKDDPGINQFLGLLNSLIENSLNKLNLKLILCGSSIMMMNKIQENRSPIYLRQGRTMNIEPMNFYHLFQFFSKLSLQEIIEIYSFTGGVPYYIDLLKKSRKDFWSWFDAETERKSYLVYPDPGGSEVSNIFRLSFPISKRPQKIVKAIADGNHKKNQICSVTNLNTQSITPYLNSLISIRIIRNELSIEERDELLDNRQERNRKSRYILTDNYIKFFYKFLYPNREEINLGLFNSRQIRNTPLYSQYLGKIFEDIVLQYCVQIREDMPIKFTKIGRFWVDHKKLKKTRKNILDPGKMAQEIDLVAYNETDPAFLFIECKWQNQINPTQIAKRMFDKLPYFNFKKTHKKTPIFMIFGKEFVKRIKKFDSIRVYCYDLADMETHLKERME